MVYNSSLLSVTGDTNTPQPVTLTGWWISSSGKVPWVDCNHDGKADIICDGIDG